MLAVLLSEVLVRHVVWALARARRVLHAVAAAYALVVKLHVCHDTPNRLRSSVTGGGVGGSAVLQLSVLEAVPRGLGLSAPEFPVERLLSGSSSAHTAPQRHAQGDAMVGQLASTEISLHFQRSLR